MDFRDTDLDFDVEAFFAEKEKELAPLQKSSAVRNIASWKLPNVDEPFDEEKYLENAKRVFRNFSRSVLGALEE
jgi:hypothetical protein